MRTRLARWVVAKKGQSWMKNTPKEDTTTRSEQSKFRTQLKRQVLKRKR